MRRLFSGRSRGVEVNAITEGVIWKTLLTFFFPIFLGTLFQMLYSTVDAIIVGKFVGKEALAAVGGSTTLLINLLVGFFVGLSTGASVVLSQFYGARRYQDVSDTVHTAILMAIVGGAVFMALGLGVCPLLLKVTGTPADVLPHATTYIRIYFLGNIPSMVYNFGSGLLRAVGDSRRPLFFLVVACMVNIVLDVVFVAGLEMGAAGAAVATVLSQVVSALLVLYVLMRTQIPYRLELRKLRMNGKLLKRIIRIGLPAALQSMMYNVANLIVQTSVNSFGTDVVAAYTAFGKLDAFYWTVLNAFGISITTFVGQNFGAGQHDRVKKSVRVCLGISAGAAVTMSVVLVLLGETLFRMFTDDLAVIGYGLQMLYIIIPSYVLFVCIEIPSGALRGVGDTLIPTLFTFFGICVVRVSWVLLVVPRHHTLNMLWYIYPITWVITSALFISYYLWGGWLKRAVRKANLTAAAQ